MEHKKFEKAKEIKNEFDELSKLDAYLRDCSLCISLLRFNSSNKWEYTKLDLSMRDKVREFLKPIVKEKIKELDKKFKEL